MKTGITGASGQLGRLVIEQLKQRGATDSLVALVRSPEKVKDLGVEARAADYDQPETLEAALKGIDTLLLISGSEVGQRERQHKNVIEAAKAVGVRWIVYTSLLHADTSVLDLAAEHVATEAALQASGIPYTLLRNGWYTQNHAGFVPMAVQNGVYVGSAGEGKISWAPRKDYAEAAAVVLTTPGHEGKIYELAGDEALTLTDLAAEISRQSGKTVTYKNLPQGEYANALKDAGLPEGLADALAGWDAGAEQGALYDDSRTLSKLLGRPTTPLADVVKDTLQ
ncbi:SDR family oxidoreductase [Ruficoccus sp. ZRK36]|uniref:SDR family oxidoreductase n=1 Tax=Ruficoccus sp. ZRK36 TaxID=2866311 RepID=UPI001C732E19|nr:SDR family oxidoreductase [Ruficoccus sp. ZRK36]QYY34535.1 SDR family oxidoreductase [Ruficoccus sp. ZRK36]